MRTYENYIAGTWVSSSGGLTYSSINPADTGEVLGHFQESSAKDLDQAVTAAQTAFWEWSAVPGPKRADVIFNLLPILERRAEELQDLITKEIGKSLREAGGEVKKTIQAMKQFSGEGSRIDGETLPTMDPELFGYTIKEPLGVGGVIAPYNFPLGIGLWKIAPAILAGNTVIFKPAENASLVSVKIMEMLEEAGLPAGVVNMVTGTGSIIGKAIGEHPDIKAVSFTGSTQVGEELEQAVTARGGKVQAEMGGKNPAVILEDADIDQAVDSIVTSGFLDNGQRCTGTSRLLVPESIYAEVVDKLTEKAASLIIGEGRGDNVDNGAIIDEKQTAKYEEFIASAKEEGAVIHYGGRRLTEGGLGSGYFVEPTVVTNVTTDMKIAREEIFAPVIAVIQVKNYEEALSVANETYYGLSSTIYTNDLKKSFDFIRNIQSGVTHVNMPSTYFENQFPFGGKKHSSKGPREQGSTALDFWTDYKTVYVKA
ncbi:aldehyde dehydrogenase family protein [Salibacterium lacus]|uniref:Aldehyde dehydrogenase family protein n=1 Tax=Salibacterium lacus TaxID=1898109 RepID=A0ABW5T455_9BACI